MTTFADIKFFSSFIFEENNTFNEEDNISQKVVEELNNIDISDIGNLEDLPRLAVNDEDCVNPKVVS